MSSLCIIVLLVLLVAGPISHHIVSIAMSPLILWSIVSLLITCSIVSLPSLNCGIILLKKQLSVV